jgi:3-phenylpropionate/trans-cinnamate dioxygenase ferredoxin subunit
LEETEYRNVAKTTEISVGKMKCVSVDGNEVLICHTKDGFFAVDAICSHAHARLDEGRVRGHRVFCPLHGAAFDVRDGSALSRPATTPIRTYSLRVEGDDIQITLSS